MNEFEDLLKAQSFREVPPEWREQILGSAARPRRIERVKHWQDWFWPSPLAWGALAAMWVVCMLADSIESDVSGPVGPGATAATLENSFNDAAAPFAFPLTPERERLFAALP
jgi:hypothetical protein